MFIGWRHWRADSNHVAGAAGLFGAPRFQLVSGVSRHPISLYGWGGRIRTCGTRDQNPMPYRLATPHLFCSRHSQHGIKTRCLTAWLRPNNLFLNPADLFRGPATGLTAALRGRRKFCVFRGKRPSRVYCAAKPPPANSRPARKARYFPVRAIPCQCKGGRRPGFRRILTVFPRLYRSGTCSPVATASSEGSFQ